MGEFELEPGEHMVTTVRMHPFVLGIQLMPFVVLAFVPLLLGGMLSFFAAASPEFAKTFSSFGLPAHLSRFLWGVWLLALWIGAFNTFTKFFLTAWIITNIRIVDIKQHTFFSREVSSFMLLRVQDVTTDVSGLLATLFGFGKISVETAGQDEEFCMSGLSNPTKVRDIIMSQVAQLQHSDTLAGAV